MIEKKIEKYISAFKNPVYYYLVLFVCNKHIVTKHRDILCKYFILYHWKEFLKYPIDIINKHFKLKNNINIFYKKVNKMNGLKKQLMNLNLKKFKSKNMNKIGTLLSKIVRIFNSIYKSRNNFYYNKEIYNIAMLNNLECLYKLYGYDFFKKFGIPIILNSTYNNLLYNDKVNYHNKVVFKLNIVLRVLLKYIIIYNKLNTEIIELVTKNDST